MPVIETPKQPGQDEEQAAAEKNFGDKLVSQFDLPASLTSAIEDAEKEAAKPKEEEVPEVEEAQPEAKEEEVEVAEEKAPEAEEDEELIPKSKVQKRLDEITREKKLLEVRLRALEEKSSQAPQTQDEDLAKLEKMSDAELASLKRQVRVSQIQQSADSNMVNKLLDLEEKIDSVRATSPQRFEKNQNLQFQQAMAMTASEVPNFEKSQKDIFAIADNLYRATPELHGSVSGKARAWTLAVEHYKVLSQSMAGKSKVEDSERRMNTLKKKISVETVAKKAATEPDDESKLFKRAKNGTYNDKLAFIRAKFNTDADMDSFLNREK
jgi:hypothetical protein